MLDLKHLGVPELTEVYRCPGTLSVLAGKLDPSVVLIYFEGINIEAVEKCSKDMVSALKNQRDLVGKPIKVVWVFQDPTQTREGILAGIMKFLHIISMGVWLETIEREIYVLDSKKSSLVRLLLDHAKKRVVGDIIGMDLVFVEHWSQI